MKGSSAFPSSSFTGKSPSDCLVSYRGHQKKLEEQERNREKRNKQRAKKIDTKKKKQRKILKAYKRNR